MYICNLTYYTVKSKTLYKVIFALVAALSMSSCIRYKQLRYMHVPGERSTSEVKGDSVSEYRLMPSDLINIDITSTVEGGGVEILNRTFTTSLTQVTDAIVYTKGYLVDKDGNIELPFVQKIKVSGLTEFEAQDLIHSKLNEYLNHITVRLRLMSFRVTFLGEFNHVGTTVVYTNKLTLLQALSYGGDITDYADRRNITIYRTEDDGKVKKIVVDMTRTDIFDKQYFLIKPNDVIYAAPVRAKTLKTNSTTIGLGLSLVTFVLLLNTYIKR